jgi:hypothetical protein
MSGGGERICVHVEEMTGGALFYFNLKLFLYSRTWLILFPMEWKSKPLLRTWRSIVLVNVECIPESAM